MAVTEQGLLAALSSVQDPHTGKDYVSTRALRNVQINGGDVAFDVELGYPAKSLVPELRRSLVAAAKGVAGVDNVSVNITTKVVAHAVQRGNSPRSGRTWRSASTAGSIAISASNPMPSPRRVADLITAPSRTV